MVDPINLRGSYGGNTYLHDANTSVITLFNPNATSTAAQSLRASGVSGGSAYQVPVGYKLIIQTITITGELGRFQVFDGGLDSSAGTLMFQQWVGGSGGAGVGAAVTPVWVQFAAGDYVNVVIGNSAGGSLICTGILTTV